MKWGNSLAVRIPKPLIAEARLKDGDNLEIEASEGQLRLRRVTEERFRRCRNWSIRSR